MSQESNYPAEHGTAALEEAKGLKGKNESGETDPKGNEEKQVSMDRDEE